MIIEDEGEDAVTTLAFENMSDPIELRDQNPATFTEFVQMHHKFSIEQLKKDLIEYPWTVRGFWRGFCKLAEAQPLDLRSRALGSPYHGSTGRPELLSDPSLLAHFPTRPSHPERSRSRSLASAPSATPTSSVASSPPGPTPQRLHLQRGELDDQSHHPRRFRLGTGRAGAALLPPLLLQSCSDRGEPTTSAAFRFKAAATTCTTGATGACTATCRWGPQPFFFLLSVSSFGILPNTSCASSYAAFSGRPVAPSCSGGLCRPALRWPSMPEGAGREARAAAREAEVLRALGPAAAALAGLPSSWSSWSAARSNVMELIEKEGNDMVASFRDSKSRTLLHLAARKGKADICSYLISEVGIDVNAAYGKGQTALKIATDKSHMETVECLLNNGADPSVLNIGPTILCMAAKFGRLGIMKLLLDKGVNVDAKGFEGTALACAARCRQICAVKFLIEHGAKVQPEPEFNSVHEVTPLSCAVSFGSFECFDLLIEAGADPKFIKNPLHAAAASGSIKLVDWFLKYGADPDYCDHVDGLKPIQVAAQRKHVDIVEFLFPWTTEISDILNWSVAGIIETYAENKPLDVSHKETTLRRISSTKMNVSILSDEEINLKIKAMVPETEYQFFSKWSAAKKRLFYESTLYGLPEPNRIFNYDVGEIKPLTSLQSSVIFDITSPSPTKAGKNDWIFQYTMKSLERKQVDAPISIPSCLDGTVTNHRQVSHSALNALDTITEKRSIGTAAACNADVPIPAPCLDGSVTNQRQVSHIALDALDKVIEKTAMDTFAASTVAAAAAADEDDNYEEEEKGQEDKEGGISSYNGDVFTAAAADTCVNDDATAYDDEKGTVAAADDDEEEEKGQEDKEGGISSYNGDVFTAAAADTCVNDDATAYDDEKGEEEKEKEKGLEEEEDGTNSCNIGLADVEEEDEEEEKGLEQEEGKINSCNTVTGPANDDIEEDDKVKIREEEKRREEEEKAYELVTGVPFRRLSQCLDAYVILRRRKVIKTRFFLPNKKSEFLEQETAAIMKHSDENDEHFKERLLEANLRRGTLFTVEDHGDIGKYRGRVWPMPPRPYSKKKGTKLRWYYLEPE
ncbi:Ankyrin-3 [Triticum urartu]|uniref:Ankyrin-3 n=2 Tax=Triticum urartu TaxID=4572 RepID=M8A1S0_TRIUA|nr:Ankyrin-3 [Triticum urartu]